jgi:UPF0716 protein FxsA
MPSVLLLFVIFVVVPIVELYVIVQVGQEIGALQVIGLLILVSIVGAWLVKRQGIQVLRRLQDQLRAGRAPTNELVDGFLVLVAGVLFIGPGFISDGLALLLLLPPTRAFVRRTVRRRLTGRATLIRRFPAGPSRRSDGGGEPPIDV